VRPIDRAFLIELAQAKRSTGTRFCEVPACTQTTREGKPFCPDHVDHNPYVQDILEHLAVREDEEDRAKREAIRLRGNPRSKLRDFADLDGPTAKMLIQYLEIHGAKTMERLARDLQLDDDVLNMFVRALVNANRVDLDYTKRGSQVVRLLNQPEKAEDSAPKPKPKAKRKPKHPT